MFWLLTYVMHLTMLCACKGRSKNNSGKLQLDKDCYFYSILHLHQPGQGWSHFTAARNLKVFMLICYFSEHAFGLIQNVCIFMIDLCLSGHRS